MLPERYRWITAQFEPEGDPELLLDIAETLEQDGDLEGAAIVYDRAYGLEPQSRHIREGRQRVLDLLAVVERGLVFRYVPAGPFLMGSNDGDPDERPLHPVWLSPFWITDTPISWEAYCRLMEWELPPMGLPEGPVPADNEARIPWYHLDHENRIRLQYCEDRTTRAQDWHSHVPAQLWQRWGQTQTASDPPAATRDVFGWPQRDDPEAPWTYGAKPMVAVSWQAAMELAERLTVLTSPSTFQTTVCYNLPTEAQWEKAARGGLIGARHAWGNEPPSAERCDFNRLHQLSILCSRTFPPNGYGLFAMNGGVWEWARDWYDRGAYAGSADTDPEGPADGKEKVVRGGSWTDCAETVTVSFRMSMNSSSWRDPEQASLGHYNPNIGFRLCRILVGQP